MNIRNLFGKLSWWMVGIGFVLLCTLVIAPAAYRNNDSSEAAQVLAAQAESVDEARDMLRRFILEHEQLRSMQLSGLDDIINSERSSQEMIDLAQKEKMEILRRLETEGTIAGILHARGYTDAAVTANDECVNIMVRALQAQAQDTARILELVISQTDVDAENIKIIPVN